MKNLLLALLLLLRFQYLPAFTLHLVSVLRPDYKHATVEHRHLWAAKLDLFGLAITDAKVARDLTEKVTIVH